MRPTLETLNRGECVDLLRQGVVGRVGISVQALPEILPVNYAVIDDMIVFRTGRGTNLAGASRNAIIAFEVDNVEANGTSGWSVLAVGRSQETTDPDLIAQALNVIPDGWVPGEREDVFVMHIDRISGRRIHRHEQR
jgi:nitroimidazol reductase NimA-like FMN-containing flavoprotein (pyridoxamine 5'-phosphate oxidase superfamily)